MGLRAGAASEKRVVRVQRLRIRLTERFAAKSFFSLREAGQGGCRRMPFVVEWEETKEVSDAKK
ncbi:MAG: hypothetical protein CW342_05090 [Thermoactinomycetaceae bacterium]|nr:hypothetical protein [Thermoactinomycetaceae bacterium]